MKLQKILGLKAPGAFNPNIRGISFKF